MEETSNQIASRTATIMNQVSIYSNSLFDNMKMYWQYWVIGALIVYIIMFCGGKNEGFFNIDWHQVAPAFQSFGRTSTLARLNDAVWKGAGRDCYPNGEFYVMRYTLPQKGVYGIKEEEHVLKGHYNSCGRYVCN